MLLATQCPHCFTSFRVANDQLKLHAGLVRCGACQQTFNGIEYLLAPGAKPAVPATVTPVVISAVAATSIEAFTPAQVAIPEAHPAELEMLALMDSVENATIPNYAASSKQDQYQSVDTSSNSALEFDLQGDAPVSINTETELGLVSETLLNEGENTRTDFIAHIPSINDDHTAPESEPEQVEVSIEDFNITEQADIEAPVKAWNAVVNTEDVAEREIEENVDAEKPNFVIQAEKKQHRSQRVRVSMIFLSILLLFSLLVQSTYGLRNHLATWFPQSKPVLQEACGFLRCRIELPAQIEVINLESNELQALSSGKNIFSLALQLQNKSGTSQAWPMLELILNDAKDQPVVRRVFTPADYLSNKNDLTRGFGANSEQTIKLYFELSGAQAAGYHVGMFYP